MDEPIFSNVELRSDRHYALYVGELRAYGLNEFVRESLERHCRTRVDIISIVPDVLQRYAFKNVIAINPKARRLSEHTGRRASVRLLAAEFLEYVSESSVVRETVAALLRSQGVLYVWMFESRPGLTLLDAEGVRLLGPKPSLARQMNSKVWQYDTLHGLAPLPDCRICHGREALLAATAELQEVWPDGMFVSLEYGAGGEGSIVARTREDVEERFADADANHIVTRYLPHAYDPTALAVVANERDVFVAGVADQRIEAGNHFRGSTYPSALPASMQEKLCECTRLVGRKLGELGYRGIFGCDYVVTEGGEFYLVEVNARKQGTTMEFCCALEGQLPLAAPSLLELEHHAAMYSAFPAHMVVAAPGTTPLHWGTHNEKAEQAVVTTHALGQEMPERDLFRRVAEGGEGGELFLEHVGAGMRVEAGAFVGRVVAVDSSRERMLARLASGGERLAGSVRTD